MEWRYFFRTDAVGSRVNGKTGDEMLGTKLMGTDKNDIPKQNQPATWGRQRKLMGKVMAVERVEHTVLTRAGHVWHQEPSPAKRYKVSFLHMKTSVLSFLFFNQFINFMKL